jgi:hypothetical protein
MKICVVCKETKEDNLFYRLKSMKEILTKLDKPICRPCQKQLRDGVDPEKRPAIIKITPVTTIINFN